MGHLVTIAAGKSNIAMPNGVRYSAGAQVLLSDEEYSILSAAFKGAYLSADVVQVPSGLLAVVAATPYPAGIALVNGTQTFLSWTAPNDGQQHRFTVVAGLHVTSIETGGQIKINFTLPDGTAGSGTPFAGGGAAGAFVANEIAVPVQAGSAVTVTQSTALTAGAAVLFAEIWGS